MQALVTRTTASVGSTMEGSPTSWIRTSPAEYMMVARIYATFAWGVIEIVGCAMALSEARVHGF
jgi:hypothetical protein